VLSVPWPSSIRRTRSAWCNWVLAFSANRLPTLEADDMRAVSRRVHHDEHGGLQVRRKCRDDSLHGIDRPRRTAHDDDIVAP